MLGRALPLINNPLHIAEEFAMIDNLSDRYAQIGISLELNDAKAADRIKALQRRVDAQEKRIALRRAALAGKTLRRLDHAAGAH